MESKKIFYIGIACILIGAALIASTFVMPAGMAGPGGFNASNGQQMPPTGEQNMTGQPPSGARPGGLNGSSQQLGQGGMQGQFMVRTTAYLIGGAASIAIGMAVIALRNTLSKMTARKKEPQKDPKQTAHSKARERKEVQK